MAPPTAMEEGVPLGVRRGAWTEEEDALLRNCIEKHGEGKWHQVPFRAGLNRCRKSCRLRWMNYLRPNIKRGSFTVDEVDLIIRLHKLLGNRWSLIAGRLPGRTANGVKNYWNTHLQKKLESVAKSNKPMAMGITKVIRPQPRTFSKSSLPWFMRTETGILNPGDHHHIQITRDNLIKITKPCTLTTGHHIQTMDNLITEPSPQSSAGAGDHDGTSSFWWNDIILDDDMEIDKEIAWSVGVSSAAEERNDIVAGQNWDGKLTPGMEKPGQISVEGEGRQSDWSDIFVNNVDLWDILIDDQALILQ